MARRPFVAAPHRRLGPNRGLMRVRLSLSHPNLVNAEIEKLIDDQPAAEQALPPAAAQPRD